MLTECKCGNPVEAKLDTDTDKVVCQSCGKEIENISSFMKTSMKQQGDIVRHTANQVPLGGMQVECNHCNKPIVALLNKKDDECYCPKCNGKVAISAFSKALLRENGQYVGSIKNDIFNGNDIDLGNQSGQVVQMDENGQIQVVKTNEEEEVISPFEKLQKFQLSIAENEAKMKRQAMMMNQADELVVVKIGTSETPATLAELIESKKKLEAQIKEARTIQKANEIKRGRGRPKKNSI